jgi:hypothetical protein
MASFMGVEIDRSNVEPVKRMHAGRFGWVSHRFDIKNGKTGRETYFADWMADIASNITSNNALLKRLKAGE